MCVQHYAVTQQRKNTRVCVVNPKLFVPDPAFRLKPILELKKNFPINFSKKWPLWCTELLLIQTLIPDLDLQSFIFCDWVPQNCVMIKWFFSNYNSKYVKKKKYAHMLIRRILPCTRYSPHKAMANLMCSRNVGTFLDVVNLS